MPLTSPTHSLHNSWRTRDINGDQFRQSKSSSISNSPLTSVPPRDVVGAQRYTQHLPFQVFCCESGTHVVDPAQSYYAGVAYRAGTTFHNASTPADAPVRRPDDKCLDSTQAWFCRDLWIHKAREGLQALTADNESEVADVKYHANAAHHKRAPQRDGEVVEAEVEDEVRGPAAAQDEIHEEVRQPAEADPDANAGSDYDASDLPLEAPPPPPLPHGASDVEMSIPNSVFLPARIMVNPRCVTTYAGVAHTQLALDLFGPPDREERSEDMKRRDLLETWETAPETFVCQEQQ